MQQRTITINATITITVEDTTDQPQPPAATAPQTPPEQVATMPTTASRVVVIPGGAEQLEEPAPAGELYVSSYHGSFRRAADCLTADGGTVLILSPKYGLTPLDKVIKPYALERGDKGTASAARLAKQAQQLGVSDAAEVTLLLPKAGVEDVAHIWPEAAEAAPLLGKRAGEQRALLRQIAEA
jgi:hypothetical protein